MIFNYKPNTLTLSLISLIGYNINNGAHYFNQLSNSFKSSNPISVFNQAGNIGKVGKYVFDISYASADLCLNWYNSPTQKNISEYMQTYVSNSQYNIKYKNYFFMSFYIINFLNSKVCVLSLH